MKHGTRATIAAVVLIVFGLILASVCVDRDVAHDDSTPPVLHYDEGGLRYTFHVLSGDEGLFDLGADPKMLVNLVRDRPDDFRRLRDELRKRLREKFGVDSPEELRRRPEVVERLRGHPYF
jgi:hypothetical protein